MYVREMFEERRRKVVQPNLPGQDMQLSIELECWEYYLDMLVDQATGLFAAENVSGWAASINIKQSLGENTWYSDGGRS